MSPEMKGEGADAGEKDKIPQRKSPGSGSKHKGVSFNEVARGDDGSSSPTAQGSSSSGGGGPIDHPSHYHLQDRPMATHLFGQSIRQRQGGPFRLNDMVRS